MKLGRTYRIRKRKIKKLSYINIMMELKIISINGEEKIIKCLPWKNPNDYKMIILKLFDNNNTNFLTNIMLIYNKIILDNNKSFITQNIFKNTTLNIIFKNDIPPCIPFNDIINDDIILLFDNLLFEISLSLNSIPIPDNIYLKGNELLNLATQQMNFKWISNVINNNNNYDNIYYKSRYGGQYKSYCPLCYEGCNIYHHHLCDIRALRLVIILPQLINAIDNCCSNYNYSDLFYL